MQMTERTEQRAENINWTHTHKTTKINQNNSLFNVMV